MVSTQGVCMFASVWMRMCWGQRLTLMSSSVTLLCTLEAGSLTCTEPAWAWSPYPLLPKLRNYSQAAHWAVSPATQDSLNKFFNCLHLHINQCVSLLHFHPYLSIFFVLIRPKFCLMLLFPLSPLIAQAHTHSWCTHIHAGKPLVHVK